MPADQIVLPAFKKAYLDIYKNRAIARAEIPSTDRWIEANREWCFPSAQKDPSDNSHFPDQFANAPDHQDWLPGSVAKAVPPRRDFVAQDSRVPRKRCCVDSAELKEPATNPRPCKLNPRGDAGTRPLNPFRRQRSRLSVPFA